MGTPAAARRARSAGACTRWAAVGLAAFAIAGAGPAAGQEPTASGPNQATAPAAAPAPTLADLHAELERLRSEYAALAAEPSGSAEAPDLEARKRAAARLITLLLARIEAAQAPAVAVAAPVPLSLSGRPPHATMELDRLRDQLDGLEAQRAALRPLAATIERDLAAAVEQRRKAVETLRLRQELLERASGEEDTARARAALQLARLEARVAELEVSRSDAARGNTRARLEALASPIEELTRRIDQARASQRIDEADLAAVVAAATQERRRIAAQRARVVEAIASVDRDPHLAGPLQAQVAAAWRHVLAALGELDAVEGARAEVWGQRRAALDAGPDPAAQLAAAQALQRSIEQGRAHARAVGDRVELLRSEARVRRARTDALPVDSPERAAEAPHAAALQQHVEAEEQLQATLRRYVVLLERTHADISVGRTPAAPGEGIARLVQWSKELARRVWEYELFSATETLQVDGRAVTVDYGVTVGKSLGALLLAAAGWWIAAGVSRRAIDWLVRRGKLGVQLGRVLHRWVMTVLLLVVLVLVLKLARIPLTAFAFLGGALAIGLGFGAQNVIKNLICGVIILFERKIRVGDIITIGGVTGTVTTVDLRATTVRGFDGIESLLPNSHLLENLVADWSQGGPQVRSSILLTVAYGSDAALTAECALSCLRAHPSVLSEPAPEVLFEDFGSEGMVFKLLYWFELGGPRPGPVIASDVRFAVERELRSRGIHLSRARHEVRLALA